MNPYYVWKIMSYAWTEIGIEDDECRSLVDKGEIRREHLKEVDWIIFTDVCASFAVTAFLVVPLMLWPILPDWGYSEESLRRRIRWWSAWPWYVHLLNPVRWFGYPIAVLFALKYRSKLRKVVLS